jgi:glycosyltransferase involved in cell wall biosynthesis
VLGVPPNMKVCFICNEYPPARHGGIGATTRTLGRALVKAGHQVRVIGFCPQNESAPLFESDRGVLVRRLKIAYSRLGWIRARYLLYKTVAQWIQAGLVDLIEAPDYQGLTAGWPPLRVPVVTRSHGSSSYFSVEMGKRPDASTSFIERASMRRADFLCSCSRYAAERTRKLFRLGQAEIAILNNFVTLEASSPEARRCSGEVVFSGTLTAKKGVVSLVRAWAKVFEAYPAAELQIFGKDGRTDSGLSMRNYLTSLLPPPARKTIHFHGHVEYAELRSAFRSANVAVFPSYAEAFALAPMEAMAEGCPTIYSRRGSGAELIEDGTNGLLVDPDDAQGIADSIIKILKNANLAQELGRRGRETIASRYSVNALLARNVEFYSNCMRSFRDRHAVNRLVRSPRAKELVWHHGPSSSSHNAGNPDRIS